MAVLLSQGAESRIFQSIWLGRAVIVKQRFSKKYRHPDLDSRLTKERIKAEAKFLVRCKMLGIKVPTLLDVNLVDNELIIENLTNSLSVRQFIIDNSNNNDLILKIAHNIGSVLSSMHVNNIIHGDLTTSNMLLVNSGSNYDMELYMIDFGLSFISEQPEDKAVDLYVLERAIQSTHPNCDTLVDIILNSYREFNGEKSNTVLNKLNEVRMRGRKRICFG